jgi:ADP-ribose pyrophosphatase
MKPWKTKTRSTVLDQRPWLLVENHTVELPDGRLIPDWPWVITPDYVNVVAVTADEHFICFRQVKYGIEGTTLGIVGGFVEEGEEPIKAARRELMEETGYESTDWIPLGSYRVDPNRGVAMGHLFLARQARYVAPRNADDLEEQELLLLTRAEAETALARGEFKVLAWAASVAFALRQF